MKIRVYKKIVQRFIYDATKWIHSNNFNNIKLVSKFNKSHSRMMACPKSVTNAIVRKRIGRYARK